MTRRRYLHHLTIDTGHQRRAADWLGDFERCVAWAWIER